MNFIESIAQIEAMKGSGDVTMLYTCAMSLLADFPEQSYVYIVSAVAFNGIGRLEDENKTLQVGRVRFPDDAPIAIRWALSSHYRRQWGEASERWTTVRAAWPHVPDGYHWAVSAYRESGKLDHAQALLDEAIPRFPENEAIAVEAALLAARLGDWNLALQRWGALDQRAPGQARVSEGIAQARLGKLYAEADTENAAANRTGSIKTASTRNGEILDDNRMLMLEFESLGVDCEFGLVQRAFGAEPLSLLRWGGAPIDRLIAGLDRKLTGLGEEDELELTDIDGEYYLHDRLYNINMHTFIPTAGAEKPKTLSQMSRRMIFLKRLFLANLEEGGKILVYKDKDAACEQQIIELHKALLRHGNCVLLFVQRANGHPSGIRRLRENLFHARLARLGSDPIEGKPGWNIPLEDWIGICRQVYKLALEG